MSSKSKNNIRLKKKLNTKKNKIQNKNKSKKLHGGSSLSSPNQNNYLIIGDIESCKKNSSPLFCNWEFYNYLNNKLKKDPNLKVIFLGDYFDKGTEEHMKVVIEGICNLIITHNQVDDFPIRKNFIDLIKFMYKQSKLCHLENVKQKSNERVIVILGNRDINKLRLIYEQSNFDNIKSLLEGVNENLNHPSKFLVHKNNDVKNSIVRPKNNLFISHSMVNGISKKNSFEKFGVTNDASISKFVKKINKRFQDYIDSAMKHWSDTKPGIDINYNEGWESLNSMLPTPWKKNFDKLVKCNGDQLYTWFKNTMGLNPRINNDPGSSYLLKYFCPKTLELTPPEDHNFFQTLALGDNFCTKYKNLTTPSMVTNSILGCDKPNNLKDHINLEGFCNKHGLKALVSGHKPVCFPIPLFYNHDGTTFIFNDLTQDNELKIDNGDYITPVGTYNPTNDSLSFDFLKISDHSRRNNSEKGGSAKNAELSNLPNTTKYGKLNKITLGELNSYYSKPFSIDKKGIMYSNINLDDQNMILSPGAKSRDKRQANKSL